MMHGPRRRLLLSPTAERMMASTRSLAGREAVVGSVAEATESPVVDVDAEDAAVADPEVDAVMASSVAAAAEAVDSVEVTRSGREWFRTCE